jgi:hypothetical protein
MCRLVTLLIDIVIKQMLSKFSILLLPVHVSFGDYFQILIFTQQDYDYKIFYHS